MEKRLWISCGNNGVDYSSRNVSAEESSFTALTVHALPWEGVAKAGLVMSFVMDTWNTAGLSAENAAATAATRSRPRPLGLICMDALMRWVLHTSEPLQQPPAQSLGKQDCSAALLSRQSSTP